MADVPNPDPPVVHAADERRHKPASDALWNESWYFDVADPVNEVGAYLRFGLYPNLGRTWFQLTVVGRDRPLVMLHDETAPSATGDGMHLVTERWSCAMTIEEPLRRFRVGRIGNRRPIRRPGRGLPRRARFALTRRGRPHLEFGGPAVPLRRDDPLRGVVAGDGHDPGRRRADRRRRAGSARPFLGGP